MPQDDKRDMRLHEGDSGHNPGRDGAGGVETADVTRSRQSRGCHAYHILVKVEMADRGGFRDNKVPGDECGRRTAGKRKGNEEADNPVPLCGIYTHGGQNGAGRAERGYASHNHLL